MIDVILNPFGRNLMLMGLAVAKHQVLTNQRNAAAIDKQLKNISKLRKDTELTRDISLEINTNMLDKRFNTSKQFINSGGGDVPSQFNFKKSLSKEDKNIKYLVNKQALKSRSRLNTSISQYNKRLLDKQTRASFKLVNLKAVL